MKIYKVFELKGIYPDKITEIYNDRDLIVFLKDYANISIDYRALRDFFHRHNNQMFIKLDEGVDLEIVLSYSRKHC